MTVCQSNRYGVSGLQSVTVVIVGHEIADLALYHPYHLARKFSYICNVQGLHGWRGCKIIIPWFVHLYER